jgi:membrane protein YqaA with SNARE-associated domain
VTSVLGGLFGYLIGMLAIDAVLPLLVEAGYGARYEQVIDWFATWGVWVVFIAGFSPIPYKLFTIAAGASAMPLLPFALASLVGRGARFFLVAGLMRWGGAPMERALRTYIDRLGWLVIALGVAYVLIAS